MQSEINNIASGKSSQESRDSNAESILLTEVQSSTVLPTPSSKREYFANVSSENVEKAYRRSALSTTDSYHKLTCGDDMVIASHGSFTTEVSGPVDNPTGLLDSTISSAISNIQDQEWQIQTITSANSEGTHNGYATGSCIEILDRQLSALSGQYPFNPIELARLAPIRQAVLQEDYLYLFLHQCVTLSTLGQNTLQLDFPDMPRASEAFNIFDEMLAPSSALRSDLLLFFAEFPVGLSELQIKWPQVYALQIERASNFLVALRLKLDQFETFCRDRRLPPMAHQIENVFTTSSPVLQKLLFTTVFRSIWSIVDRITEERAINLFIDFQNRYIAARNSKYQSENHVFDAVEAEMSFSNQFKCCFCQPRLVSKRSETNKALLRDVDSSQTARFNTSLHIGNIPCPNQNATIGSQSLLLAHRLGLNLNSYFCSNSDYNSPNLQHETSLKSNDTNTRDSVRSETHSKSSINQLRTHVNEVGPAFIRNTFLNDISTASQIQTRRINQQRISAQDREIQGQPVNPKAFKTNSRLITRTGRLRPQRIRPYPEITALHQSHLAGPIEMTGTKTPASSRNFYRQVSRLCMFPSQLKIKRPINIWTFFIPDKEITTISSEVKVFRRTSRNKKHYTATRYRLRCSMKPISGRISPNTEEFWIASNTCWPNFLYVKVNTHLLEFRRKLDHGKDIPVDITNYVHGGENVVKAYMNLQRGATIESEYYVFVEEIETAKLEYAREKVLSQRLSSNSTLLETKQSLDQKDNTDFHNSKPLSENDGEEDDRDLLIIGSSPTTINLFDPILSNRIYDIPVRGRYCIHRDCFDLDIFLQSRPFQARRCHCQYHHDEGKVSNGVSCSGCSDLDDDDDMDCPKGIEISISSADNWKCPVCKRDARPKNLVVDEFLLNVREQLARDNMLDTRAIRVDADGKWEVVKNNNSPGRIENNVTIIEDDEGSDSEDSPLLRRKPRCLRDKLKHANAIKKVREKIVIDLSH